MERDFFGSGRKSSLRTKARGLGIVGMSVRQCGEKHLCARSAVIAGKTLLTHCKHTKGLDRSESAGGHRLAISKTPADVARVVQENWDG